MSNEKTAVKPVLALNIPEPLIAKRNAAMFGTPDGMKSPAAQNKELAAQYKETLAAITIGLKHVNKTHFEITPQVAADILQNRMTRNRNTIKGLVDKYADLMMRGKWSRNIAPIAFINDPGKPDHGFLIDGQHRLTAQVQTKTTAWYQITILSREEARFIDTGRMRTSAQNLAMFVDGAEGIDRYSPILNHMHALTKTFCGSPNYVLNLFKTQNEDTVVEIWNATKAIVIRSSDIGIYPRFSQNISRGFLACIQLAGYSPRTDVYKAFLIAISAPPANDCSYLDQCYEDFRNEAPNGHDTNRKTMRTLIKIWNYVVTGSEIADTLPQKLDIDTLKKIMHVTPAIKAKSKSQKKKVRKVR